jgi:hypothetical protein
MATPSLFLTPQSIGVRVGVPTGRGAHPDASKLDQALTMYKFTRAPAEIDMRDGWNTEDTPIDLFEGRDGVDFHLALAARVAQQGAQRAELYARERAYAEERRKYWEQHLAPVPGFPINDGIFHSM